MPLRQPERHPGRLLAEHEEVELRAEPAVVARLRLLDPLQVGLELRLGEERGAVDPGQHLAALVAAPVGAGERAQLERLDPAGRGAVRAAAEVLEGPVAIQRDGLDALVADQVLDQLDLVCLALRRGSSSIASATGSSRRSKGSSAAMWARHRLLDPLQVASVGRSRRGTRSRSRSRRRSAGRSRPSSPATARAPPRPSRAPRRGGSAPAPRGRGR